MPLYHGNCHRGSVRFDAGLTIRCVNVCNCSICSKNGIRHHRVAPENF
jgi:hypothetical protein